jgi:hypothetical protein
MHGGILEHNVVTRGARVIVAVVPRTTVLA